MRTVRAVYLVRIRPSAVQPAPGRISARYSPPSSAMVAATVAPSHRISRCSKATTVPVESRGGAYPVGIGGSSGAFATGPQSDSREHVSSPRSPNPAGRSPAPGSPVESCDSHTGSRSRPADGSRERWDHARTLALAGRCVVRPVDALATATMQVVPLACACDDSPEFLLISGVLGRRPLP